MHLTADELEAVNALATGVLDGRTRALARALSLAEDGAPGAAEVLAQCRTAARGALVVGFTGPPGAGKSSLVEALLRMLRASGRRVGVLATDPSSPLTGGAFLGDRIRMGRHHSGVFIRSMATRGCLGGLSAAAPAAIQLLAAAGYDLVLLETVGVGQNEIAVASVADVTVLVLPPGLGDDVQALKAGVMELADVFAVNKSDLPGADALVADLRAMQSLAAGTPVPVVMTQAHTGAGVAELWTAIERRAAELHPSETARRDTVESRC